MEDRVVSLIERIDIEKEIRKAFHIGTDDVRALYINRHGLTVETFDCTTNKPVALEFKGISASDITTYFGYYWFKEFWFNWKLVSLFVLKRCSEFEPGLKRFLFDPHNTEFGSSDPWRFWTFKFDLFTPHSVNITPFKQIVEQSSSAVRFSTFVAHLIN
jgi:hypothetical protein